MIRSQSRPGELSCHVLSRIACFLFFCCISSWSAINADIEEPPVQAFSLVLQMLDHGLSNQDVLFLWLWGASFFCPFCVSRLAV
jgi:hypothetical protein